MTTFAFQHVHTSERFRTILCNHISFILVALGGRSDSEGFAYYSNKFCLLNVKKEFLVNIEIVWQTGLELRKKLNTRNKILHQFEILKLNEQKALKPKIAKTIFDEETTTGGRPWCLQASDWFISNRCGLDKQNYLMSCEQTEELVWSRKWV